LLYQNIYTLINCRISAVTEKEHLPAGEFPNYKPVGGKSKPVTGKFSGFPLQIPPYYYISYLWWNKVV